MRDLGRTVVIAVVIAGLFALPFVLNAPNEAEPIAVYQLTALASAVVFVVAIVVQLLIGALVRRAR